MKVSKPAGLLFVAAVLTAAKAPEPAQGVKQGPSVYLRCDGNPDNVSTGETAARVLAITALVGLLIPANEHADASKRESGAAGVAACTEALSNESNANRRIQLILARAIHQIEAGDHASAIEDARLAETDQPALAAAPGFRLSYHLSALEIEGLALLAMGKQQEAAAKGLAMGEAAPYELINMLRAQRLVAFSANYGPEEARYYDALVRIYPEGLGDRARARQLGGDFKGAAEDMETWDELVRSLTNEASEYALAQAAISRGLAGEVERAEAHAAAARESHLATIAAGKAKDSGAAAETLDLYRIWSLAREGKASEARLLFGNRSSWTKPYPAAVSEVARQLRIGAKAEELTGLLAADPVAFRTDWLAARARAVNEGGTEGKARWGAIRAPLSLGQLDDFSGGVWKAGKSRYFAKKENDKLKARLINVVQNGDGIPAGYAVLLHSALQARAEGKSAFMLLPMQKYIYATYVRTGNPGEAGVLGPISFDVERVIADLAPLIPAPASGH